MKADKTSEASDQTKETMQSFRIPQSLQTALKAKAVDDRTSIQAILVSKVKDFLGGSDHIRPDWTNEEQALAQGFVEYLRFKPRSADAERMKSLTIQMVKTKSYRKT